MMRKNLAFAGLAGALLFASQAFACPTAPLTGYQTYGGPVCIAHYGTEGAEEGLQNILSLYNANTNPYGIILSGSGPNVYQNQAQKPYWSINASGISGSNIVLELSQNANSNTMGIFDPTNPGNTLQLFEGPAGTGWKTILTNNGGGNYTAVYLNAAGQIQGTANATFGVTNLFGYYLSGPGGTFYSLPSLNEASSYYPNGTPHMVAYDGTGATIKIGTTTGVWSSGEYIMAWEDSTYASSDLAYQDFVVLVESVFPVPEPAVLGMFGLGLVGVLLAVGLHRRRQKVS